MNKIWIEKGTIIYDVETNQIIMIYTKPQKKKGRK